MTIEVKSASFDEGNFRGFIALGTDNETGIVVGENIRRGGFGTHFLGTEVTLVVKGNNLDEAEAYVRFKEDVDKLNAGDRETLARYVATRPETGEKFTYYALADGTYLRLGHELIDSFIEYSPVIPGE